uniref:HAUS augmin-like complex subunit 8 n=1 Tax=Gouania willdenowi TaxID=441366 RepID=A0A8C5EVL5_GOUWI
MASRKSVAPSNFKNASNDGKSSKSSSNALETTNSAPGEKAVKPMGTFVKSRYMQAMKKTSSLSKSNSLTNDSVTGPLRPSSPKPSSVKLKVGISPRRSVAPQAHATSSMSRQSEPSLLGKSVLQSTFSDGHCFRPDFDLSVIKEKTVMENAVESERSPENEKKDVERQTFLLAYLTAQMQSNTAKFKADAEAKILQVIEDEEMLHNEVKEKKQRYLLAEKKRLIQELLDVQISSLAPVADAAKQFTNDYKSFSSAIDTTRHELPVKNYYIDEDRSEFLDKAESCLKESESLLLECIKGDHMENSTSLQCLRDLKTTSKNISQQLSGSAQTHANKPVCVCV